MPLLGEIAALVTAFLWSGSALVFAAATQRVGSFQVNITRLLLATLFLGLCIAAFRLDLRLSGSQVLNLSLSGFVGLTLGDTFLFKAFQEIGARISMLIMSLAPAIGALLAYTMLGESLSFLGVLGIVITLGGIVLVVFERKESASGTSPLTATGVVFALLGAAGQGCALVFAKAAFMEGEINGFVASEIRIVSSLLVLLPVAIMTRRWKNPWHMHREDSKAFWLTALGSVFGPFLGITFSLISVAHAKVGVAATIMALVPVLMLPLVRIIHKERLSWRAIVGAFVAVAGVAVLFLR